mgnify:CR=1 FL=1
MSWLFIIGLAIAFEIGALVGGLVVMKWYHIPAWSMLKRRLGIEPYYVAPDYSHPENASYDDPDNDHDSNNPYL